MICKQIQEQIRSVHTGESAETPVWTQRDEVPERYRWRLEDIFASEQAWEDVLKTVPSLCTHLFECRGRLAQSAAVLLRALEASSDLDETLAELVAYARMRRDENNASPRYQDMTDRVMAAYYKASEETAFLLPEIAGIPEPVLLSYLTEESGLAKFEHLLHNQIRQRPHILNESEEKLLSRFGQVTQGIENIHTMLDNVDLKLGRIEDEKGQTIELTLSRFAQLRDYPHRQVRADAFRAVHQAYAALGNTFASLYSTQVKADLAFSSARRFSSSLEAALFSDNLPQDLYSNLISSVRRAQPILNRYLALRKRLLDLKELHIYDTYLPITNLPRRRFTYETACSLVREALKPLGEAYMAALDKHLTERWVDVYETPAKTSGAYSWGTYRSHPYILLNFSGTLSDVFTLAHELGHSLHTWFSSKRPFAQAHYPILLAEIASTVNENLLMRHMLAQCDDSTESGRQEKAWLLNHHLEGFRLTVFRQTMFAEFESRAHARSQSGDTLNADALNRLYSELLIDYFGPDTVIDDYMCWEWSRIPHFYNSFYVFKYATGFTSAVAIAQNLLNPSETAIKDYLLFLSSGGSDYPLELLRKAGIDLKDTRPVDAAMLDFEKTLAEFENLAEAYDRTVDHVGGH